MKTLIASAAIGALALGSALADRPVTELKTQADNADYEYVTVTGSHLKQKIRKRNIITDTRNGNVLTIDQREMQRNGASDVAGMLSHYPGIRSATTTVLSFRRKRGPVGRVREWSRKGIPDGPRGRG